MTVLGFDRSRWNAEPDFAAFRAGGGGYIICKATEGLGFTDPTFTACRTGTEAVGLVFGSYHFARWGDPVAEARFYLSVATPRAGELVALDAEAAVPAGVDVVAWCLTFCQTVHAACGAWPLLYMNQSWLAGHNWAPLLNDGLWLAKYDGQPTSGPTGPWPVMAMKQYTDRGTVPGEPGTVDVDAFEGDPAALLRYAVPGAHPLIIPTVQEDDMRLIRTPDNTIWAVTDTQVTTPDPATAAALQKIWGPYQSVEFAEKDAIYLDAAARLANWLIGVQNYVLGANPQTKPYLYDRVVGLGTAVAALQAPTVDASAVAAALAANAGFTAALAAASVAALDADVAKRFGAAPPA